jgi:type VI protein secretion system component VasK
MDVQSAERNVNRNKMPTWWMLDGIVLLMVGLLVVDAALPISPFWSEILMIATVLLGYGFMWVWLGANRRPLQRWDADQAAKKWARQTSSHETEEPTRVQVYYRQHVPRQLILRDGLAQKLSARSIYK